jgi:hypothetical protein
MDHAMQLPQDTDAEAMALAQRFAQCDPAVREWAERQGYLALESRMASGAAISARVHGMLTVLLGALAAAGTLAVRVLDAAPPPAAWGALAAGAYIVGLLVAMMRSVVALKNAPAARNRPGLLAVPGATLEQLQLGELARLDERIRQQTALNKATAGALNRVYLAAALAPLVLAAGCWAAWLVARA